MTILVGMATVLVAVASSLVAGAAPTAVAASAQNFNPGYIISDQNFFNGQAMNESEVQYQLNVLSRGCQSGYTCLKDYRQDTWNRAADPMCGAYQGGGQESAARIIAKVGAACGISQKVLLVLLEKEQSLVTSTAPTSTRYGAATGFACPDTAPCDQEYYGFYNQVYKAAWQFKRYSNPAGTSRFFTWYPVGQTSNIQFNPNPGCSSAPVHIANQATANLYYYTPYQPNASALANLYGTGDDCGAYGNRNFWRIYSDWFGSPTDGGMGDFTTATGGYGGIHITGWSADPTNTGSSYVWVNINGTGGPFNANKPVGWFNLMFPGYGPNHGFDETIARPPGTYEVCVTNTANSVLLGCKSVVVPKGTGGYDSLTSGAGTLNVTGWGVSYSNNDPVNVRVSINGKNETFKADKKLAWINSYFPGIGEKHGFNLSFMRPSGTYTVCVTIPSGSLGCKTTTITADERGDFTTASGVAGGVRVTGWSVDLSTKSSSYVWATVDGRSVGPIAASKELSWFEALFPGAGTKHGFDSVIPLSPGTHQVCLNGTAKGTPYGCKTATVPSSEVGDFTTAEGVAGGIRVTGWSVDLTTKNPSYVWVTVDGNSVGPIGASNDLPWFEALFAGAGTKHGFDAVIPQSPGAHQICLTGTANGTSYGCKTVTVPTTEVGDFTTAKGVTGGIRITGWSADLTTTDPSYIWISVDGASVGPALANIELPWFEALFAGAGTRHGFDTTVSLLPGSHEVCLVGTANNTSYGCKTATAR
jgi:hypothetical protein